MKTWFPLLFIVTGCSWQASPRPSGEAYFAAHVRPVLEQHCLACHRGVSGGPALDLTSRASAFASDAQGRRYIFPGAPERSLLITAVQRGCSHPRSMPRTEISLTDDQIGLLREWIEDGAAWPLGPAGKLRPHHSSEVR